MQKYCKYCQIHHEINNLNYTSKKECRKRVADRKRKNYAPKKDSTQRVNSYCKQ